MLLGRRRALTMSLRNRTIALVLATGLGGGARAQEIGRDSSLDLFFDPSRPAVRQLYLPGTRVLRHLDTEGYFAGMLRDQKKADGAVYTAEELASPLEGRLDAGLRRAVLEGRYAAAHLSDAGNARLEAVKSFYPSLDPEQGQWARVAMQAANDFIAGRDRHAVLRASYALSLNPVAPGLEGFLAALERETRLPGFRIPSGTGLSLLEVKLNLTKELFQTKRYEAMIRLCRDVLVLKPGDLTALARLGSGFYMLGRFRAAESVWTLALADEGRDGERKSLSAMIARARQSLNPKPKPPPASVVETPVPDPKRVASLRREGVAAHAAGRSAEAARAFEEILLLAPDDRFARKALRRLEGETR
ncbi:MAG: hypothetical protein COX66_09860 [Elusimicrobia bacterium CG_4_10_14_0_2_um_filter_63_34]|nr:MAG: hypothetical protein COX66_09860 [Elusimicrobia bacterium CG_4_10_14_0_2_um_filter_63_34]